MTGKILLLHLSLACLLFSHPGICAAPKDAPAGEREAHQALLLHSAMLAGDWLVNNQNTKTLWGSEPFNGDYGRWLYEYKPEENFWRGSVCWTTATGIMDLFTLYRRTGLEKYRDAALRAGDYLKSLQMLDSQDPRTYGTMHEMSQLDQYIFPRDGMTSTGGFLALYRHTGEQEYLERAKLYADWYLNYSINPETGWPISNFPYDESKLTERMKTMGWYQGGGGIFLYHLYKVTGDKKYRDGLRLISDGLIKYFIGESGDWKINSQDFGNNDDFGAITLLAAYLEFKDRKYWNCVVNRLNQLIRMQREDGAIVPGNTGGCFISGLTALNMLDMARRGKLALDTGKTEEFIRKLAEFANSMQVTDVSAGAMAYGGFWGQLNLADFKKTWIHSRGTTYSVLFNLRYEGIIDVPYYSVYGWD